jgi:hypothetical protein
MRLKKLGLAVMVAGVFGAIVASSASAVVQTVEAEWYTGTNPAGTLSTTLTGDETVTLRLGKHQLLGTPEPETKTRFTVKVGVNTYELTATGIECEECKITNGAANSEKAMGDGRIKFTGVTVMQPSPECKVAGGTVTTNPLKAQADYMHEGKAYVKFEPTAGPANAFATVSVIECPLAANLVVKGSVFGEALNATGVGATEQPITFSKAIHETTQSTINVGGNTAILEGQAIAKLASGAEFGVK